MKKAFHINFKNGSNPYFHFACPIDEHMKALRKWKRRYTLKLVSVIDNIEFYTAEERYGN